MALENLGGLAMQKILSRMGPADAVSIACVSRSFRTWALDDDSLWSKYCFDELQLDSPQDPNGNAVSSFKVAYHIWREAFHTYPWSLVIRVKRCWNRIRIWLAANFPEVVDTLRKGVSEDELKSLEMTLKLKLPLPTRVLYRFCNGQEVKPDKLSGTMPQNLVGLIGGYSFYEHLVNVFLLPLELVVSETKGIIRHLGLSSRSKHIVVAASCAYSEKIFFLNCSNGQLYVGTRNLTTEGEMLPCVPASLIRLVHDSKGEPQDAMLLWLEEHCRRLENGIVKVRQEGRIRGINHFPELPPLCPTTVTHGVKVRASAVFVPEFSNPRDEYEKFLFAYSVRMSLLPEGCIIDGMNFSSCQLHWRHWTICVNDTVVDKVNGEAVIGKFPLLHPGKEEFVYESCTSLSSERGSIEGYFTFIPGRLAEPKGSPFAAYVAAFPLELPDYIF